MDTVKHKHWLLCLNKMKTSSSNYEVQMDINEHNINRTKQYWIQYDTYIQR